ncbi:phage tail termination protein [Dryocola clanedunensis]
MTPSMHDRVKNMFSSTSPKLTQGFTVQTLLWTDTGSLATSFMVFRPNSGTAIRNDIGSEYYVLVDVIGAKGKNADTDKVVDSILDYVQANPFADECVGKIENVGGKPSPVLSEEGRLIYRLQFACTFGD